MKRILFLDVTGVLSSQADCGIDGLGESHLHCLKRIVDEAKCEIVLTSTWRLADDLLAILRRTFDRFGIPIWIDLTPDLIDRAEEIMAWLEKNGPCIGVIVDDNCDGFDVTGLRFFQTSFADGLTFELSNEIIVAFGDQ
jgi:hypothetical protein